ncbi:MAG TPA: endonuclease/exonuclease/phosphatase family protein [Acidimicrobiales bacterium]|nr:endonuclease/exonuclease/phosphatase family protein [Acidimicrobiales bacterium]
MPLLAVAAARLVAWDSRSVLIALNAVTPALFLPAWVVAAAAGATRRWALLGGATAVVVAHVAFLLPELTAREALPDIPPRTFHVRLFSANVYNGNRDAAPYAEEIRRSGPDFVFLQEATPTFLAAVDGSGAIEELPHRVVVARTDPFATVVASRWPLLDHDVVELDGRPILVRATVDVAGAPLRLFSVHVVAPFGGARRAWARELRAVAEAVRAEQGPVLVAGDFNATWGNREFRRLLEAGLTDAAAARGRPFQMTWPRDRRLVPPLARIDHVLTTPGLAVTGIWTGGGQGSDHRPIVAVVAVRPLAGRG